jgi:peptidoglycan glycosyltransferase
MNRPIRKVAIALAILLTALFLNLNWVQVVKGSQYRDDPQNRRVLLNEYASPRGQIIVQGSAIAESKGTQDQLKYLRVYPQGPLYAPVTGFYSINETPSPYLGTMGIESSEDSVLSGNDPRLFGSRLTDLLTGRNPRGGSVELTLNKAAQQAAYQYLIKSSNGQPRRGAVVALDPTTGAILAAVSTPSYDPTRVSSHDTAANQKYYDAEMKNKAQPLLNRAFNQLYPPGSTFKVIVSAAALKKGIGPDNQIPAPRYYWPDGGTGACPAGDTGPCIHNFTTSTGPEVCDPGHRTATMTYALAKSCNTAFAALAVQRIGAKGLANEAKLFGLDGAQLQVPLSVAVSTIGTESQLAKDPVALGQSAFGQRNVRVTPLQDAMIAAAVANHGTLMKPYLVDEQLAPDLSVLSQTKPSQLSQVIDPTLDSDLQEMMRAVVTAPEGTGQQANIPDIPGVTVAGKTGTADTGEFTKNGDETPPDAWFTGYADLNGTPKIAVAVVIENGGVNGNETTGGAAAAPVAKAVMEAYLKSLNGH